MVPHPQPSWKKIGTLHCLLAYAQERSVSGVVVVRSDSRSVDMGSSPCRVVLKT